jgi:hypothetical protein
VTEREDRDDPPVASERPDRQASSPDAAEPDWAAEIHRLRRARGDRLRRVFSSFDDEQEER